VRFKIEIQDTNPENTIDQILQSSSQNLTPKSITSPNASVINSKRESAKDTQSSLSESTKFHPDPGRLSHEEGINKESAVIYEILKS
jgi:hypothetical protein